MNFLIVILTESARIFRLSSPGAESGGIFLKMNLTVSWYEQYIIQYFHCIPKLFDAMNVEKSLMRSQLVYTALIVIR